MQQDAEEPSIDEEEVKRKMKATVDEYINIKDKKEVTVCLKETNDDGRRLFVETLGNVFIEQKDAARVALLELLDFLCSDASDNALSGQQLCMG